MIINPAGEFKFEEKLYTISEPYEFAMNSPLVHSISMDGKKLNNYHFMGDFFFIEHVLYCLYYGNRKSFPGRHIAMLNLAREEISLFGSPTSFILDRLSKCDGLSFQIEGRRRSARKIGESESLKLKSRDLDSLFVGTLDLFERKSMQSETPSSFIRWLGLGKKG